MPMNTSFLHCMWSDRESRLNLTRACEFFFFSQGWTYFVPVWTSGPVLDPYWLICGFMWTIGEHLVGSLLDRIGFLGHFVIGLSVAIVCVIAVLRGT